MSFIEVLGNTWSAFVAMFNKYRRGFIELNWHQDHAAVRRELQWHGVPCRLKAGPEALTKALVHRLVLALVVLFVGIQPLHAATPQLHWTASWATAIVAHPVGDGTPELLRGQQEMSLRESVHLSAGGKGARVVFTNEFGVDPLQIDAAALRRGTHVQDVAVTFAGRRAVVIPPGAVIVSDAVQAILPSLSDLTITFVLPPQPMHQLTQHTAAHQTNMLMVGNALEETGKNPQLVTSWYFLKAIYVDAPPGLSAVVAMGDSITDGTNSTSDANRRWPDDLARRLLDTSPRNQFAVLNEGIGGNRVLHENNGPAALARLQRDVLSQPGLRTVIVLEGINDIAHATDPVRPYDVVSTEELINAFQQIVFQCHLHRVRVIFGTLTPYDGNHYFSPAGEQMRRETNRWIRTNSFADGFVDFDAAIRDPQKPSAMLAKYDSGDHLHPSDAGYQALADRVDLTRLVSRAPARQSSREKYAKLPHN